MPRRRKVPYPYCRSMGHSWAVDYFGKASASPEPLPESRVYRHWWLVRTARCPNCNTKRIDYFVDRIGGQRVRDPFQVLHRRYVYPEGYRVVGDMVSRSEASRALFAEMGEV